MVYYLTRFASWLAGRVPRRIRLAMAGPMTVLVYYCWPEKRHATLANVAQVLGKPIHDREVRRVARRTWRNYGRYVSDFFYLPNATHAELVARLKDETPAPGVFATIDAALARGKGVLLASAHFGAWDIAGVMAASHCPIYLIVESFEDPRMDRMIQAQRRKLGMELLPIEKTPRQILRVLQTNGVIGVAVDRPVSPREGVPVTFFGKTCYVPGGIPQLALKTGATILPGFCWYDKDFSDTYYLSAGEPIIPESTGDKRADVIALTQRMYDAMEVAIREHPDQWAMFRQFWPDDAQEAVRDGATAELAEVSGERRR